jgi:hypothetical protein
VEKAIARQVLHGGDLTTNLFEVCPIDEAKLAIVLSETFGLPAAPAGKLKAPEPSALAALPGDLVAMHGIFPLSTSGETLTVATPEPLSIAVQGDLASAAGMDIRQVLAPALRIRGALRTIRFATGAADGAPAGGPGPPCRTSRLSMATRAWGASRAAHPIACAAKWCPSWQTSRRKQPPLRDVARAAGAGR